MRSSAQHVSKKRRQHSQRRAEYVPRRQRRITTLLARKRLVSDRIESTSSVAASGRCSFFSSVEAAVSAAESTNRGRHARHYSGRAASSDFPLEKSTTWPEIAAPRFSSFARKYFNSCSARDRCCERCSNRRASPGRFAP